MSIGAGPLSQEASSNQNGEAESVGFTFVELMFAVAVGDAAMQIGKVMQVVRLTPDVFWRDVRDVSPSLAHLVLTILVIACSWVEWRRSETTRSYMHRLKRVFSWPFVIVLVDIFLVICYFVLAEGAEIPERLQAPGANVALKASARSETFWIAVIMATYVVWNVLAIPFNSASDRQRLLRVVQIVGVALLAALVAYKEGSLTKHRDVLCVDLQLVAIVLLFRGPIAVREDAPWHVTVLRWAWLIALLAVVLVILNRHW